MYYNYSDLSFINRELAVIWPDWSAVKLLGRGGFGAVYEIHRNIRGNLEKAAMKVLRVPDSDTEIATLQFQGINRQSTEAYYENLVDGIYNEIRTMQRFVGNSHIVSYEDYAIQKRDCEIGWDIYIRMELLTGLPDYMARYPMSDQMVIKLGMDISQGLNDCHSSGIIHRDIKPENIFVNERGNFKLGDFGVSRNTPGSQDVLSFKGTLGYMAPEVYRMISTDARSDIYSLGMVLYQCLNDNRLPFMPENFTPSDIETAWQRRISGESIPAPAHGSERLKALVLKAVAYRPEDRFQTAEEMHRTLQNVNGTDHAGSGAKYQNRDSRTVGQKNSAVNHNDVSTEAIKTNKAPQEQFYPKRNTKYQPDVKKSIPKTSAKVPAGLIALIAATVIVILLVKSADIFSPGHAAQNGVTAEQGYTDYAIDWKDAALEAKMREITGIHSGNIKYSDVKDLTDLDLSNFIDTDDNAKIKDISALSSLTNLTKLNLSYNQISDISSLSGLTNLTDLNLCYNQISNVSALSSLTNLTDLDLSYNQISNVSALSSLTNLTGLDLYNNQISDISALSSLTNLTKLDWGSNQISDISSLSGLTNLTDLDLGSNQISDISLLSEMSNLTYLDLSINPLSDISPLNSLTNLKTLFLIGNPISDVSALSSLTNLTRLDLIDDQISDISPLSSLTNLICLRLEQNQISDISSLSEMSNLEYLYLGSNQISDISPLSELTNLTDLDLSQNQISDISPLSGLSKLNILGLSDNPIADYSPIENLNIEKLYK